MKIINAYDGDEVKPGASFRVPELDGPTRYTLLGVDVGLFSGRAKIRKPDGSTFIMPFVVRFRLLPFPERIAFIPS
jgi:hypothetical protein